MATSASSSVSILNKSQDGKGEEHSCATAIDFADRLARLLSPAQTSSRALAPPSLPAYQGFRDASLLSQQQPISSEPGLPPVPLVLPNDEKSASALVLLPTSTAVAGRRSQRSRGRTGGRINGLLARERTFNSTGRPPLIKVPPNNVVFRVVQSFELLAYATSSTTLPTFVATFFVVGNLDQITSLANVFDQYRIDFVEAWLTPRVDTTISSTANPGIFHSVIDFDDAVALPTIGAALDYTNCMMASGVVGHYRCWKPHVAGVVQASGTASVHNLTSPWLDVASTGVQHYGLKTAWTVTDTPYVMDATFRLHISFRNVR